MSRLGAFLRTYRDVVNENLELRDRVVSLAQENDAQRVQLRSAGDMLGHLKRQVQDRDATVAELQGLVADLARDMDALVGITEDGA